LCSNLAFASEIEVKAKVDSARFLIGDWVPVWIEVVHSPGVIISPPVFKDSLQTGLSIINFEQLKPKKKKGRIIQTYKFTVSAYDTGEYKFTPVMVNYKTGSDSTFSSIYSDTLRIKINSAGGDTLSRLNEIKPPVDIPRQFADYLPYLIILILIILGAVGYWYWRRRKQLLGIKAEAEGIESVHIDPYDKALRRLTEVEAQRLWERGFVKEYYSEISEILREYFEGEFSLPALEMTTYELITELEANPVVSLDTAEKYFRIADFVKFARFIPEPEGCRSAGRTTYDLLKEAHSSKIARELEILAHEPEISQQISDVNTVS
jgi:hypothetical protein